MKPGIFCSAILINCCCLSASAETNSQVATLSFTLPTTQLRSMSPQEGQGKKVAEPQTSPETAILQIPDTPRLSTLREIASSEFDPGPTDRFSATVRGSDLEMQVYKRLEEGGYLTRPEPETPLEHFLDRSFSPEVIHLGRHAVASCTLYTAIVRKNPLCLLNPMFLFISW